MPSTIYTQSTADVINVNKMLGSVHLLDTKLGSCFGGANANYVITLEGLDISDGRKRSFLVVNMSSRRTGNQMSCRCNLCISLS